MSSLIDGIDNGMVRDAGSLRAKAMEYRDAHENFMTHTDWTAVNEQLQASYRALKEGVRAR